LDFEVDPDGGWRDRDYRASRSRQQLLAAVDRQGQTRFDGFDDKILSLYARDMTVREIQATWPGSTAPRSRLTDAVLEEVREWRSRPLDSQPQCVASSSANLARAEPLARYGARSASGSLHERLAPHRKNNKGSLLMSLRGTVARRNFRARDPSGVEQQQAEVAVVICVEVATPLAFHDDLVGKCCRCGYEVQFRPHAPKKPPDVSEMRRTDMHSGGRSDFFFGSSLAVLALLIAVFFALLFSDEPLGAAEQMVRTLLK
jgi:hypothetical protein